MAVRMMIDKAAYEAGAPGVEVVETTMYGGKEPMTLYMQTTYQGLVVDTFERNGYDDSDFYAVVWDVTTQAPKNIMYGTTRGWSYPNGAVVDATPEVAAAYQAFKDQIEKDKRILNRARKLGAVERGKMVKVFKGRKLPIGVMGRCFWTGVDRFGKGRVGIDTGAERVFTAMANVEVLLPVVG